MCETNKKDIYWISGEKARDLFEYYSKLLIPMQQHWAHLFSGRGGQSSSLRNINRNLKTDTFDMNELSFSQLDRNGRETYPRIVVLLVTEKDEESEDSDDSEHNEESEKFENNDEYEVYLSIYWQFYGTKKTYYFPLNDDFVPYKPKETFEKWIECLIRYEDKRSAMQEFNKYLRHSERIAKQRSGKNAKDLFEFYSNLLIHIQQHWAHLFSGRGGQSSSLQNIKQYLKTDTFDMNELIFCQLDRNGRETYPRIVVKLVTENGEESEDSDDIENNEESEKFENNDEYEVYLIIYRKLYGTTKVVYFPLNDDFVQYKPIDTFKKWIECLITYKDERLAMIEFNKYLDHSKRIEKQRVFHLSIGKKI